MVRILLTGVLALLGACTRTLSDDAWLAGLPNPWELAPDQLAEVLPRFEQRYPDFEERLRALAIWRVGTPYGAFRLGEEQEPDPDPLFRLDVSDCTSHILTSLSLAQSRDWDQARRNMVAIHYKPAADGRKVPTYNSRWHYTTDRIMDNPSTQDITASLVPADQLATAEVVLNRKADGGEFLNLGWERPVRARYIPSRFVDEALLARLPALCGIAFVKEEWFDLGLVVGHEGMLIDRRELIHAGLDAGETAREDFLGYLFRDDGPLFAGIMVFRFLPLQPPGL